VSVTAWLRRDAKSEPDASPIAYAKQVQPFDGLTATRAGRYNERTRDLHVMRVDINELPAEDDEVAGQPVAEKGSDLLQQFHRGRRPVGRGLKESGARPHG